MKLIIFSGLPGTGKSTLAERIAREFGIPVFAKDWLEASLLRSDQNLMLDRKLLGFIGYELLSTLAERQLMLEQSVILDSVASVKSVRDTWYSLAKQYGAGWRVIECICSQEVVHRQRLKDRTRNILGWHELDWSEVERVKQYYSVWEGDHLVLDMVQPFHENLSKALKYCE